MTIKRKPFLPYFLLGVLLAFCCHRAYALYALAPAPSMTEPFSPYVYVLDHYIEAPYFYSDHSSLALLFALIGFLIGMFAYLKIKPDSTYRHGEESGSARFATPQDLVGFQDKEAQNNMIFTKNAQMGLLNKRLPFEWQLNKNVLVVGLPGDGKTFTYVKPNLMQMNSSFVVTDPKGLLVHEVGTMLENHGYHIKVFDLVTLTNSDTFNPFHYMHSELDIDRITEAIVEGTKKGDREGEDFWTQAKLLLNRALIGYLYFDSSWRNYDPNLSMVADMLRHMKRVDDETPSPVEIMFDQLEEKFPNNYAGKQWQLFNANFEAETRTSVLAIVSAQYSIFDHEAVTNLISNDSMQMERWNTEKTAVFVAISETNKAYNFLASTLFTVMFDQLTHNADAILQGEREGYTADDLVHVQFYLDEFANVGKIPHLNETLASVRSREMSIKIIVQAINQLRSLYGNDWKTILNNCATLLFLGTNDEDTMKYFSMRSGKQTITQRSYSEQRGQRVSGSTSYQTHQRDLMTPDEIARIGVDEALVFISKQNVLRDKKASVLDHPLKDELANNYQDDKWYHYKRYMTDIDDFLDSVSDAEVFQPDLSDYQDFLEKNGFEPTSDTAILQPVSDQLPKGQINKATETPSQTSEDEALSFTLPDDEEDYYGEV